MKPTRRMPMLALLPLALTALPRFAAAQDTPSPATKPPAGTAAPNTGSPAETVPPQNTNKPPTADVVAPQTGAKTPAQQKYGLPRNPAVGAPVDTDLNKPLSLDRAIHIGLLRQNTIAISQAQRDAANARLTQARSGYYPQITPTLDYNTSLQPGGVTYINGQAFRTSGSSETRSDLITARYNIYDTGLREASVGNARRNLFGASYGLADERQSVILQVTQAYYNLARYKELVKVQEQNVVVARENLAIVLKEIEVGQAAKSDRLQLESQLANAQVSLLSAQSDYQVGQANLKNIMGVITSLPLVLTDDNPPAPSPNPDPLTIDDYLRAAYINRDDVKRQQEFVNAQGYNVRTALINAGFTVNASINQGYALDPNAGEQRFFLRRVLLSAVRWRQHPRRCPGGQSAVGNRKTDAGSAAADRASECGAVFAGARSGPSAGGRRADRSGGRTAERGRRHIETEKRPDQ